MDAVTLPPELERFAEDAVAASRLRNVPAVVTARVRLLQCQDEARAELLASVLTAKDASDREGCLTGDAVEERIRAMIAGTANARREPLS